jgi:hypothetical protein
MRPSGQSEATTLPRWPRAGARGLVRRLRMCLARTSPGGLGSPSVPTTWGCPQGLDEGRMNPGESLGDQGERMLPVRPRKHGPEAQNRRQWSAERRARLRTTRTAPHTRGLLVRLPALHSPSLYFRGGGTTTAHPAPQIIRAAERWLDDASHTKFSVIPDAPKARSGTHVSLRCGIDLSRRDTWVPALAALGRDDVDIDAGVYCIGRSSRTMTGKRQRKEHGW